MKRFKFRLDPVIRYQEYRERIAQIGLARETQALVESKNRISEIEQARRFTVSELEIDKRIREKQEAAKVETMKKKTLEWIKQTQYSKHLKWINRAEQKAADELIGLKKHEV